ncbi:MAG: hypothetical protein JKY43_06550 [Phycisphaerales bacterium]|nr:hypothetical protein [Phycisphaerales bacterium]
MRNENVADSGNGASHRISNSPESIEYRVAFAIGNFRVSIIYFLANSGLSIEEIVRVIEIQSSLWVFAAKMS